MVVVIPDWGHALCSVPGKHCWQVWCFQIASGFVEIFNIPKVDWRCHSKRDSWNVSSTNSTNRYRFQLYMFFLNLLSLWIIHFNLQYHLRFLFCSLKMGPISSVSPHNFPPISITARALVQRRLRTGTVCLQCLLRSHRGHRGGWVDWVGGEAVGVLWWPDTIWWSSKKKLGGTKPPMNRWSTPWNCMGW